MNNKIIMQMSLLIIKRLIKLLVNNNISIAKEQIFIDKIIKQINNKVYGI